MTRHCRITDPESGKNCEGLTQVIWPRLLPAPGRTRLLKCTAPFVNRKRFRLQSPFSGRRVEKRAYVKHPLPLAGSTSTCVWSAIGWLMGFLKRWEKVVKLALKMPRRKKMYEPEHLRGRWWQVLTTGTLGSSCCCALDYPHSNPPPPPYLLLPQQDHRKSTLELIVTHKIISS